MPVASLEPRSPAFARVSLAVMTHSPQANLLGNVHGGEIVKLADSTAGAVAQRHSGGPAVTAALDEMVFLAPVHVGDIVLNVSISGERVDSRDDGSPYLIVHHEDVAASLPKEQLAALLRARHSAA